MGFRHCAAVGDRTRLTSSTALHRMSMPATMAKRRVGAATSDEDAVSAQQKAALPPLRPDGAHCCRILHRDRAHHICT